jgi:hypothetical protein
MTHSVLYIGDNTHVVELVDLVDHLDVVQTDANVQMTALVDKITGETVTGVTLPLDMLHVAAGLYRATLPHALSATVGRTYLATIKAVGSQGFRGEWIETLIARARAA